MKGNSECVVAIIKGLHDAGLSVTLLEDWPSPAKILAISNNYQIPEKISETHTNLNRCQIGLQVCNNGQYASSCQRGECSKRPPSPPGLLSGFPPQRADPNKIDGNFKIGVSTGHERALSPHNSNWSSRGLSSTDRATVMEGYSSSENNAFAHSLRKYPDEPKRTISAELVQRLVTYTQTKNLTKSSYQSKSVRSLNEKNTASDKQTRTNSSKNIQTYTRAKRSCKENGNTTEKDIKFDTLPQMKESSKCHSGKSKDNLSFKYNYLKSSYTLRGVNGRNADVRYLTDVKRCIRETVRQMCQDRPAVCPSIRSRYSYHRREHHGTTDGQHMSVQSNTRNTEDRASSPLSRELSVMVRCDAPPASSRRESLQSCLKILNICCYCKKPLPCACKLSQSKNKSTEIELKCGCLSTASKTKITTCIIDWIKTIPVYSNESLEDKARRDKMVKELADGIIKAVTDENFTKVKEEVDKCLNDLPMWLPDDESERETFKNQIAESLIGKLRGVAKKDNFTGVIEEWIKSVAFDDDVLKKGEVVKSIAHKIKSFRRFSNNEQYKETLISGIVEVLKDLPIKTDGNKNQVINRLANNLAISLMKVERDKTNDEGQMKISEIVDFKHIKEVVKDEVHEILNKFNIEVEDRGALEETISNLLDDEIVRGVDPNKIRQEIYSLLRDANISDEQAEHILNMLTSRAREMSLSYKTNDSRANISFKAQSYQNVFKENATEVVLDFINNMNDDINPKVIKKVKEVTRNFIDNLAEIMVNSDYDKNAVLLEISNFLEKIPIKSKTPKEELAGQLLQKLQNINVFSSTPYKPGFSFRPRREPTGSISSIEFEDNISNKMPIVSEEEKLYNKELTKILCNWIDDLQIDFNTTDVKDLRESMINDLVADIIVRQKYLQLNPDRKVSEKDELEHLKYQVFRWLNKLPNNEDLTHLMPKTEALMDIIKSVPVPVLVKPALQKGFAKFGEGKLRTSIEDLTGEISIWFDDIPKELCLSMDTNQLETSIEELARKIKDIQNTGANIDVEIINWLGKVTNNVNKNKLTNIAQSLLKRLKNKELSSMHDLFGPKEGFKKAADILYENIESWCEKLPIYGSDLPEERAHIKAIKQNVASKLINKIGELNMDPEIFQDDLIYMELIQDEIDNLLSVLPINKEIEKNTENLKLNLINKIKEVKEKTSNELAGHYYKQHLRDAISRILPSDANVTENDEAYFQNLREDLADAYINLHYFGARNDLRNKFKTKINEEITKFCKNYLKRFPAKPLNTSKLNRDLYNELKNVPIPTDESVINEVEVTRMKDEIQDWMKELPLTIQTEKDKQHTNKIILIMSKRLHDIEKDKDLFSNYTEKLKTEITKWMKQIPSKPENETKISEFANKLIERLRNTEESRRFSVSLIQHSDDELLPSPPPSSLTLDDYALLQRIRDRTITSKLDASVSPPPIDASSQTDIRPFSGCTKECGIQKTLSTQPATQFDIPQYRPCSNYAQNAVKTRPDYNTCQKNRQEISPRVTVKEYCWDSTQESSLAPQNQPCINPEGLRRPSLYKQPSFCSVRPSPYSKPHISAQISRHQTISEDLRSSELRFDQEQEITNAYKSPRLSRIGSLDAVEELPPKRPDHECPSVHFPDTNEFWSTPCSRRRIVPSKETIERPYVTERERKEEKVMCSCKEHVLSKCSGRKHGPTCQNQEDLKKCSRCCGSHCPYPSYLYFR